MTESYPSSPEGTKRTSDLLIETERHLNPKHPETEKIRKYFEKQR